MALTQWIHEHIEAVLTFLGTVLVMFTRERWKARKQAIEARASMVDVATEAAAKQLEMLEHQVDKLQCRIRELEARLNETSLQRYSAELMAAAASRGFTAIGSFPMPGAVVLVDEGGVPRELVYFNEEYGRLFGVKRSDMYRPIEEVHDGVVFSGCDHIIPMAFKRNTLVVDDVSVRVDNTDHQYMVAAWPIRVNGKVSMVAILGVPVQNKIN